MLGYAEAMIRAYGDYFTDEVLTFSDRLADKALQTLINEKRIEKKMYADEHIVVPVSKEDCSLDNLNAFEAYSELVKEIGANDDCPEFCFASKTASYPFHFVFTAAKQNVLYRVLVFGADSNVRLGYFNSVYDKGSDGSYITLLVVPSGYSWEDFENVSVKGKVRIARIEEDNPRKKRYSCLLDDVFEDL